jgi:hypothetical protein
VSEDFGVATCVFKFPCPAFSDQVGYRATFEIFIEMPPGRYLIDMRPSISQYAPLWMAQQ